jgi:hypothetical protein
LRGWGYLPFVGEAGQFNPSNWAKYLERQPVKTGELGDSPWQWLAAADRFEP